MPTKSAVINGVRLVYEYEGAGEPIVFFHGFNGSSVQFETLIPFLMDGHTCIAPELRGHGRSDRSAPGTYITKHLVAEATSFLEQVVSQPAIIFGQSLGGLLAFAIAAQRPELVSAIYSEDAVPMNGLSDPSDTGVSAIVGTLGLVAAVVEEKRAGSLSFYQFANRLAARLPQWAKADPAALVAFARLISGSDPQIYAALTDPDDPLTLEEVQAIERAVRCPVHVARADPEMGAIVTEAHVERLAASGMNVTSTYFPGAGHLISPSNTRAVLADFRAFLARIPKPS